VTDLDNGGLLPGIQVSEAGLNISSFLFLLCLFFAIQFFLINLRAWASLILSSYSAGIFKQSVRG
jgi:hypothetical protein